MFSVSKPSEGL